MLAVVCSAMAAAIWISDSLFLDESKFNDPVLAVLACDVEEQAGQLHVPYDVGQAAKASKR